MAFRLARAFQLKIACIAILLVIEIVLSTGIGLCSDSHPRQGWNEFGLRMGMQVEPRDGYFHQYEAFGIYGLPWEWRNNAGWGIVPKANAAVGALHGRNITGAIGSLGTALVFNKTGCGLEPEAGINANVLDRRRFDGKTFGSSSPIGSLFWPVIPFQGWTGSELPSAAHLQCPCLHSDDTPNPGLDMHFFGVSWRY